jgi:phage gpG-like protein
MMHATIIGDRETIQRLERMPETVREVLRREINTLSIRLLGHVKADKLSGQVLNVRSGRLRRSINFRVEEVGSGIYGYVGTTVEYARVHEYGFKGVVSVREHLRRTVSGKMASVRAHPRNVNVPERSFLRSALEDMAGDIREGIRAAATKAVKK